MTLEASETLKALRTAEAHAKESLRSVRAEIVAELAKLWGYQIGDIIKLPGNPRKYKLMRFSQDEKACYAWAYPQRKDGCFSSTVRYVGSSTNWEKVSV